MKVVHRIGLNSTAELRRDLALLAKRFIGKGNPLTSNFVVFEIAECDPDWPAVRDWIRDSLRGDVLDIVHTTFDEQELSHAKYLSMDRAFVQGYPQPDADYRYRAITYSGQPCQCAVGMRQVAPFQFKKEPNWGRNGIMQLTWVEDEYFVTPRVWEKVFRPHGIDSRPVSDRKGRTLETVVQLVFAEEVGLDTSGLAIAQECALCGQTKFKGIVRGYLPRLCSAPGTHGFRSKEVFGYNLQAYRQVIVSQSVRHALQENKVRGVTFVPVEQ
jgi:hypothetical protein